jgi:hypothetical protein
LDAGVVSWSRAITYGEHELYYWPGWQVRSKTVADKPTVQRILKEQNQTEREVLMQEWASGDSSHKPNCSR